MIRFFKSFFKSFYFKEEQLVYAEVKGYGRSSGYDGFKWLARRCTDYHRVVGDLLL